MFKKNLISAFRNIRKYKIYSLINIAGLSVAICAALLIYIYVSFELNYDSFQKDGNRIFRVSVISQIKSHGSSDSPEFVDPLGPEIKREIPEVEQFTRISTAMGGSLSADENHIQISNVRFADSTFFKLFSFKLVNGKKENVLTRPFTAVITAKTARRLFGGEETAIGKTVKFNNVNYEITGIAKNPPSNSHFTFNMLLSFGSLYKMKNVYLGWNGGNRYITYVKLESSNQAGTVNKKLIPLMWKNINSKINSAGWKLTAYLQPLKDIHLKYDDKNGKRTANIYIFSIIALFIILIACVNYVNISIAGALKRSKEIGVKKVFGASRLSIVGQFVTESLLIILISAAISLIGISLLLPSYKHFLSEFINTQALINTKNILLFLSGIILIGLISSLYPAGILSRLTPIAAINENKNQRISRFNLRNALILFQFVISIGMIISTLIISSQLNFIKNRNLGFQKKNMLVIPLNDTNSQFKYLLLKNEISKITGVEKVTASSEIPGNGFTRNGYKVEGEPNSDLINVVDVDKDFIAAYKIKLLKGRNFTGNAGADKSSYLVNEKFVKQYGLKNPLGKIINRNGPHKIIGMVSDFNFASAYQKIRPLIITAYPESGKFYYLSVSLQKGNTKHIIDGIAKIFHNVCPAASFNYTFMDEALENIYTDEANFKTLFVWFSSLAIFISIIGLLGLTIFSLTQKRKEIGIRKVLGASVRDIVKLSFKEYLLIIIAAFIIASIISKYFMNKWLENFAYRIEPSAWLFLFAGLIAVAISFVTVLIFTIRAATANPIESLKYE